MTERTTNIFKYSLLVLIVLTLTFIFSRSFMSREESSEESESVSGWLSEIISPETGFGSFFYDNIRKIAHFVEFGALGAELTLYALLFLKLSYKISLPLTQLSAFFAAFIDETIQIFSNRGPMIADVWLDLFGSLTCSGVTLGIYFLIKTICDKKRRGREI